MTAEGQASVGPAEARPDLVLDELTVALGGAVVLQRASARFLAGALTAVIGRSGAGKSVLLKAGCGLLPLAGGEVGYGALRCAAGDDDAFAALRQRVVFVHQDPALLDDLSVAENVAFAAVRLRRRPGGERAAALIAELGLAHVAGRRPSEVSPGMLRRVALARALATDPEVLIVDEPTTGLDPHAAREVDAALAALQGRGTTLVVITHDRRSLETLRPRLCWVQGGRVAWEGAFGARFDVADDLSALLRGEPTREAA